MAKFEGFIFAGTKEPRILVYLNVPAASYHRRRDFLVDTGANVTVLDAALLGVKASTLGPPDPDGIGGVGGISVPAWQVTNCALKIRDATGHVKDVTPNRILAIDGPGIRHVLGTNALEEYGLRMYYNPRSRRFTLATSD